MQFTVKSIKIVQKKSIILRKHIFQAGPGYLLLKAQENGFLL